ncbi:MAG: terminase [Parabacteroides sp.]|nr:terminase [Parabacteroides sp.]
MAKKDIENKKELARILFMNGENQKDIADRVAVSRVSINKWVKEGGWAEKRAAKAVTRPELVNKMLRAIDTMLEKALESDNPDAGALGDKLAKVAATIEKLDKKSGVVNSIEVFIAFGQWLDHRMSVDKEVDAAFIKKVTKYQDAYINEQFAAR